MTGHGGAWPVRPGYDRSGLIRIGQDWSDQIWPYTWWTYSTLQTNSDLNDHLSGHEHNQIDNSIIDYEESDVE